ESRVAFLDHHLAEYVKQLPPSVKIRPQTPGDQPGKWSLVERRILRQAGNPFVTEELYLRKKVAFNPRPPGPSPSAHPRKSPDHPDERRKAWVHQRTVDQMGTCGLFGSPDFSAALLYRQVDPCPHTCAC
ncbi:hypothetical protein K438DRAFT_2166434, partial [Mycena galopus ATCC 62051]